MKKLLVFREGLHPDSREVEDYLYDSEAIRDDFFDLAARDEIGVYHGRLSLHATSWDVTYKDDDKFDFWHIVCEGSTGYAFEEPAFIAAMEFFKPEWRQAKLVNCRAVLHKNNYMVSIYRLPKAMSEVMSMDLKNRLESFKDGKFHYETPADALGPLAIAEEEREIQENAKG
jgi:hypothetical protein